jgi:type IV secretory pathway ATPase VirB11/archaellum biosynthesis ATPase
METTTVLLKKSTRRKLEELKTNPNESIDSVVDRLANMAIDSEPLSKDEIESIKRSLADIEAGRVRKLKDVAKEMGLE